MLPQKQVTNVSLVLKNGDMESENLSSLILLSVSDGLKRCIIYRYIIKAQIRFMLCNMLKPANSFASNDNVAVIDSKPMPRLYIQNKPHV